MLQQRVARSLQQASRRSPAQPTFPRTLNFNFATPAARLRFSPIASQRWYSENTAPKEEAAKEQAEGKEAVKDKEDAAATENPLKAELETKKEQNKDLTDRLKRQIAEYRNLQEQTKREVSAAREFSLQRFAKDLLDSIDNLDRALDAVPTEKLTAENQDLVNLHSGLKMTEEILSTTLKRHGMEKFDPTDEKFDPNKHEATFQVPMPDKEDGSVFHVQSKGFLYNGRVLRAAKVGVVKNS